MTKEEKGKYSKNLLKMLEMFEEGDSNYINLYVFSGKPKWEISRRIKDGNKEIKTEYEGNNLEDLMEEFFK